MRHPTVSCKLVTGCYAPQWLFKYRGLCVNCLNLFFPLIQFYEVFEYTEIGQHSHLKAMYYTLCIDSSGNQVRSMKEIEFSNLCCGGNRWNSFMNILPIESHSLINLLLFHSAFNFPEPAWRLGRVMRPIFLYRAGIGPRLCDKQSCSCSQMNYCSATA